MKSYLSSTGHIYLAYSGTGLPELIAAVNPDRVYILADENTSRYCVPILSKILDFSEVIIIPAGEKYKNVDSCRSIWSSLIRYNATRESLLINVGGGMICDIGGFSASCYQRGIRYVQMPTSVLAMADAALGGKTGIDYEDLKNYIGLIGVPSFVWIDPVFLQTLPHQEKISGLTEIVKHAIVGSSELWDMLKNVPAVDSINWEDILEKNLPVKLNVVEADPYEKGLRKILNFGHTVGHALESYFLDQSMRVSHGQCVATGMLVEAKIANSMGLLNNEDFISIERMVNRLLDPVRNSLPTFEALIRWIRMDKKKKGETVGFSLPDRIGSCGWDIPVNDGMIADSLQWLTQAEDRPERLSE